MSKAVAEQIPSKTNPWSLSSINSNVNQQRQVASDVASTLNSTVSGNNILSQEQAKLGSTLKSTTDNIKAIQPIVNNEVTAVRSGIADQQAILTDNIASVKPTAEAAKQNTSQLAQRSITSEAQIVSNNISNAKDSANSSTSNAKDQLNSSVSDAKGKEATAASDAQNKANNTLNAAKDQAPATPSNGQNQASTVDAAKDKASSLVSDAKGKEAIAASNAQNKANNTLNAAKDQAPATLSNGQNQTSAVDAAKDKASSLVSDAKNFSGEELDKLISKEKQQLVTDAAIKDFLATIDPTLIGKVDVKCEINLKKGVVHLPIDLTPHYHISPNSSHIHYFENGQVSITGSDANAVVKSSADSHIN